jgi:malate dehydrogenase (oxaloacetate-decarboxylating)
VKRNFPNALLQWEDFAKHKAFMLLERYRDRILSFDDDIQGTGAVTLAAMMSAMRIKSERFRDQTFVIAGMGQAGTGIASNIRAMLREEGASEERVIGCDVGDNLADAVRNHKATVLIGATATAGLFDDALLRQMALNTPRPVIFALSNPTSKSECTPEQVAAATNGQGLVATGSPFPGTSQCNNMYVFPGVGLGALVSNATKITDAMFLAASRAVSALAGEGRLLPELEDIREVSAQVAKAVACEARDSGLGRRLSDEEYGRAIRRAQWQPRYYTLRAGR